MIQPYFFIIISIFCFIYCSSNPTYAPFSKNKYLLDTDEEICYYENGLVYVKGCKEGKYCKDRQEGLSICEEIENPLKFSDSCQSSIECDNNYYCDSGKCTLNLNCGTSQSVYITNQGIKSCISDTMKGLCFKATLDTSGSNEIYSGNFIMPEFFKVCGKITKFDKKSHTNNGDTYYPLEIENSYIGTVDDGEFVYNEMACKSGFALYFYANKGLKNPSNNGDNHMFKMCVTLVDYKGGKIKYKIGGGNENEYNLNQLRSFDSLPEDPVTNSYINNLFGVSNIYYDNNLKIQSEIFQKYISVLTSDKQKQCAEDENNMNEPNTCNDDQLRKWYYFLDNVDEYILYYKRQDNKDEVGNDVVNYLIQQKYPLYQNSKLLEIKYFLFILILLF